MHPSLGDRALYKRHCLAWSRKGCADVSHSQSLDGSAGCSMRRLVGVTRAAPFAACIAYVVSGCR